MLPPTFHCKVTHWPAWIWPCGLMVNELICGALLTGVTLTVSSRVCTELSCITTRR